MIFIGKTTARPADHGNLDLLERADDVTSDTAHIGDFAVLADPDATVNTGAQMLCKLAENVAVDGCAGLIGFYSQWAGFCLHLCHRSGC